MDRDFYGILNIPRDASKDEIREAYLRLARQYHPDLSKKSNCREQFEEINQAYTILSDDESRPVYNHLCREFEEGEEVEESEYKFAYGRDIEETDENRPWWQQTAAIGAGMGICAVLAGYGLVQYAPTLEQGLDSLAVAVQSKKNDFEISQKEQEKQKQLEQPALSQALPTPKPTLEKTPPALASADSKVEDEQLPAQPSPEPSKELEPPRSAPKPAQKVVEAAASQSEVPQPLAVADSKVEKEQLPPQTPVLPTEQPSKEVEPAVNLVEQGSEMPSIKPSARNYELLAFYSLVIGDLTQFRNAIKLAYQEDPSFDKLNALNLSLHQLEVEKLPPEITLKALRSLVLQQYTERLLPSQLSALQAKVQNVQNVQNTQTNQ
jgi:curved DNA-binding protein CbpA